MAFKIEYLSDAAVVHVKTPFASNLVDVANEARNGSATAKTLFGASAFQVRDLGDDGKVVMSEAFVPVVKR